MSLATQINLPPIHEPIMKMEGNQMKMTPTWTKWFNDLYDLLSLVNVEGRDDAGGSPTYQERIRFIQLPTMTTTTRDKVNNPPDGLIMYNETTSAVQAHVGGSWTDL